MAAEKDRLLARKQDIERRLAEIEKAEKKKREKHEQRRAELAGRAVLKHARKDEELRRKLHAILDAEITGARLRALFDLPPKSSRSRSSSASPSAAGSE